MRGASQGIADSVDAYLAVPPDPWVPAAFLDALSGVGFAAQAIADDAVQYLGYAGCTGDEDCGCLGEATPCAEIDPDVCTAQVGCS